MIHYLRPLLFFFGICTLAFFPLLGVPYLYDDQVVLQTNELLGSWSGLPRIWAGWVDHRGEMNGSFRPAFLTLLSFFKFFFRDQLILYRLTSFFIHSINAVLILRISQDFFRLDKKFSYLVAFCFLLHPIQGSGFALIWKQSDLWAGFFFLSSTYFWYLAAKSRRNLFPLSILLFPVGLLFKESLLVLPLSWLLLETFFEKNGRSKRLLGIGICALFSILYFTYFRSFLPPVKVGDGNPASSWQYLATQIYRVLPVYLENILYPHQLSFDRAISQVPGTSWLDHIYLLGVLISFLAGLLYLIFIRRSRSALLMGLALLWLLPSSSFHPLALLYDETRVYLSVGFLILLFVRLLEKTSIHEKLRPQIQWFVFTAILLTFLGLNWANTQRFRSEESLWASVLRTDPKNPRAYYQLGVLLDEEFAWDEAEENYRYALKLSPGFYSARLNLGLIRGRKGDFIGAQEEFLKLLDGPRHWKAKGLYNLLLGEIYRGNQEGAIEYQSLLEELDPESKDLKKGRKILKEKFDS